MDGFLTTGKKLKIIIKWLKLIIKMQNLS